MVQRALPNGRTRRVTVGATNVLTLEQAKQEAQRTLAVFYSGADPKHGDGAVTLHDTLKDYLAARKTLRAKSVKMYTKAVTIYLKPWLDQPLRDITPEDVEERHRAIGGDSGETMANHVMVVLRLLWNHAADRVKDLPQNPVRRLRRQWYPKRRRTRHVRA